eukprot:6067181-Alexandrium_andersonii.AAC.1
MPETKLPPDNAAVERYRARLDELKEQRATGAAVPARQQHAVQMWLIDTGCGHDLVAKPHALMLERWIRKAGKPI